MILNMIVCDEDNAFEEFDVKIEDIQCAPARKKNQGSCYTLDELLSIVNDYNQQNNNKIELKKDRKYLLKELTDRLKNVCDDERCWLRQNFIKNSNLKKLKNVHRVTGPSVGRKWLDTENTFLSMKQYEEKYPEFMYLGTVPLDFDSMRGREYNLSNLEYDKFKGKDKFGAIFNLDRHSEPGSHWVALFANLNTGHIIYFDSYGGEPPKEIKRLMDVFSKLCRERGVDPKQTFNVTQHQRGNSECGVYSMNFIIRCIYENPDDVIGQNRIPDKNINKCRRVYFNPAE